MTPEAYVIGSIVLGVLVVAALSGGPIEGAERRWFGPSEEAFKCPRCGAVMQNVGSGVGCVVPPIVVLRCPQCGYEERSWGCPGY